MFFRFASGGPLFDVATDGGAGGGGGTGTGAGSSSGITKEEVQAMLNGMNKDTLKQIRKIEATVGPLAKLAEIFEGVKPKKLAKLLKAAGKDEDDDDPGAGAAGGAGSGAGAGGDGTGSGAGASGGNNGGQGQGQAQGKQLKDPLKKKQFKKLEEKVAALEADKIKAEKLAQDAQLDSAVNSILGDYRFASPKMKELAFSAMRPLVQKDEDGNLVIGNAKADSWIKVALEDEYAHLLEKKAVSGGGIPRQGGKSASIDFDSLGPNSKPEDLAAAGKALAEQLGGLR